MRTLVLGFLFCFYHPTYGDSVEDLYKDTQKIISFPGPVQSLPPLPNKFVSPGGELHLKMCQQDKAMFEHSLLLQLYKDAIRDILNSKNSEDFYNKDGFCLDTSALLMQELKRKGFKNIKLAETNIPFKVLNIDGPAKNERASKTHFFLIDENTIEGEEIIIDPTYLQFFDKKKIFGKVSPIFIGKADSLENFFDKHSAANGWEVFEGEPIRTGIYQTKEMVCLIYSIHECSKGRINY